MNDRSLYTLTYSRDSRVLGLMGFKGMLGEVGRKRKDILHCGTFISDCVYKIGVLF